MELLRPAQRLFARYTWMSLGRIRTGWSSTTAIHAILAIATIVLVTRIGHAPVIIIVDAPVTRLDVIATEMMDVGTICTALRAILMVSVVILTIVVVIQTGDATVNMMWDVPVTWFDVIVIEMKGAELMVFVQLTTACLVVSAKTTTATATEMMDVGTICTALRAILMVSVVILTIVVVIQTGDATVNMMWDVPVTWFDVIVIEMIDVGTICTALRAILMVSVVTIIAAAVIVTGTAPLATVSATGS